MSDRFKRLLVLLGFFLVIGLIAFAIYFVFFRATPTVITTHPSVETGNTAVNGSLPSSGVGGIPTGVVGKPAIPPSAVAGGGATSSQRLTLSAVVSPKLSGDGKAMEYYDPTDGRFYKTNLDGTVTQLSSKQFPDAQTIVWDDAANQVAIEFPDGSNVIFNFTSQTQTTLPAHWQDFQFSPDGNQVIAKSIGNDASARSLVVTNTDGSNTKVIQALGNNADQVQVSWSPNDQVIAFADTASGVVSEGLGRKMIYPLGKNQENYKGLIVEGLNFHDIWSPDGSKILYDVAGPTSNYKPLLWIVDGTSKTMGDQRTNLGLNTWVNKCTFADASTLFCAVPAQMDNNAGLQPSIVNSDDTVYRVDLTTGKVKQIGYPTPTTSMTNLAISADGKILYYSDKTGHLQYLHLN